MRLLGVPQAGLRFLSAAVHANPGSLPGLYPVSSVASKKATADCTSSVAAYSAKELDP